MWLFIGGVFVGAFFGFILFAILAAGRIADDSMLKNAMEEGKVIIICPNCNEEIHAS